MTNVESAPLAPSGLASDLAARHVGLCEELRELGANCLVAIRDHTVTYLTGYTTMTWKMHSRPIVALLTSDGRLLVLVAETEADAARLRIPGADVRAYIELEPVTDDMNLPDGRIQFAPHAARKLGELIEEAGPGSRVAVDGLDASWPPIAQLTRLVPNLHGRAFDASQLVWRRRLRKTEWELEQMRTAASVLDRAYTAVAEQIRPGMTEREIAGRFQIAQIEAGAHEVGPLAVVAGIDRGLFGFPTDKPWDADELLYLDGAAIIHGYWSDFCRTFAARPVRPREQSGYARAHDALARAVAAGAALTAGELGSTLARAIGVEPHDVGFGRFGHGIGLLAPEPPSLHPADPTRLEAGFTLCIEPTVAHGSLNFVAEEEHLLADGHFHRLSPPAPDQIVVL